VNNVYLDVLIRLAYNLTLVSITLVITTGFAPASEGSGVAPVKAYLAGAPIHEQLSLKVLLTKIVTAPMALGAQMLTGRVDGHIGAALANQMMQIPIFRRIQQSPLLKPHLIACGLALGVGANYGAPAGGMMFALEAIGTYYPVRMYIRSFYVAVLAGLLYLQSLI
jgi:chloride channel 2